MLLIAICQPFFLLGQTTEQLGQIEKDYNNFKSEISMVMGASENSELDNKKFYGRYPRLLQDVKQLKFTVGISDPFTPPIEAIQKAIKRAAFLKALKNGSKAFAVIDHFNKVSEITKRNESFGYREMVHVFVDSLYDIENAKIVKHEYLKTGELLLIVDFTKCKKTGGSAIFEIFKNTKEKGKGIQKTSKIKIVGDDNADIDYEVKKSYFSKEIKTADLSTNTDFQDWYFSYSSYKTKFGIKGGLWSFFIEKISKNILDQATEKTKNVQSVNDYQLNNVMVKQTRMIGFFQYIYSYKSFINSLLQF